VHRIITSCITVSCLLITPVRFLSLQVVQVEDILDSLEDDDDVGLPAVVTKRPTSSHGNTNNNGTVAGRE
jgi:hypothetical protein